MNTFCSVKNALFYRLSMIFYFFYEFFSVEMMICSVLFDKVIYICFAKAKVGGVSAIGK